MIKFRSSPAKLLILGNALLPAGEKDTVAEVRLIRSTLRGGLEDVIDGFVDLYIQSPFETFLVLPNAAIRDEVKRSLVERGVPVFGASICTLDELAQHFFEMFDRTEIKSDPYVLELVLYKVLEDNQERLTLFRGAWGAVNAMVPELRAFLEALEDFQVDYPRCLGELRSERTEQLALIRDLYDEALASNHLVDRGRMLERVTTGLSQNDAIHIGRVTFYGLYEPTPIEKAFIKATVERARDAEYHLPFVEGNKAFVDDGSWLLTDGTMTSDDGEMKERPSLLFSSGPRRHIDGIVKGVFRDPLDEMRSVAEQTRRLIDSGVKPSKIAVLMPVRSRSAPLVQEVLEDHGVPFSLHFETPLASSSLVMSIFSILDAVLSDYDRDVVARLVGSPFFTIGPDEGSSASPLSREEVEDVSIEAGIVGGKGSWSPALRSLRTQVTDEMDDTEGSASPTRRSKLEKVTRVETGISHLFAELSALEGELTVKERVDVLRSLLHRFELVNNLEEDDESVHEREVRALSSFISVLNAMEMGEAIAPSGKMGLREFVDRLRMLASVEGFRELPENRNAVQVSGLRASYLKRFDHVFVIGMVDGDIPFLAAGNAFLREREATRMGLMSCQDQLRQERFYFLSALMSSNVRTYISRAESNGNDMLVPSYFFDELEAAFEMDTFGDELEESSSLCCQRLVGEMISKKREAAEVKVDPAVPLDDICRRISVERDERSGVYTSSYDGVFADPAIIGELNTVLAGRETSSASCLESYARCPFIFYLGSVMGIGPRAELEEELTPADRGTLFHRIACCFYSELKEEGSTRFTTAQLDAMTERILRIGREELDRYELDGPAWKAFRATMLGSDSRKGLLRAFLEREVANGSRFEPRFFELSFGLPVDGGADTSSRERPAIIDLGGEELKLRCRVDRVDVLPDGRFVVIDYKTGSSVPSVSDIEKGTALQIPLYIQAVESMMTEMKGIGGAYYGVRSEAEIEHKCVLGDKDHEADLKPYFGERRKYRDGFAEIVQSSNDSIRSYLEGMRAGRFHPNKGPAQCPRDCQYATICRADGNRAGGENDAD